MYAFHLILCLPFILYLAYRALFKNAPQGYQETSLFWGLSRTGWWLFGCLVFLRFGLLLPAPLLSANGRTPEWVIEVFTTGTYIFTLALIWRERARLEHFHVDISSGVVLLGQQFFFPIGLASALLFWRRRIALPRIPTSLWRWMLIGPALAILAEVFIHLSGLNPSVEALPGKTIGLGVFLGSILIQCINAGVLEEPLFRGFLWGVLRHAGLNNLCACIGQALLFTIAHLYYLPNEPFMAWFIRMTIPGLLLGVVAWRSRSITASILTHGVINASGQWLIYGKDKTVPLQTLGTIVACLLGLYGLFVIAFRLKAQRNQSGDSATTL